MLRPEAKERDQDKFVAYTESWLRAAEMEPAAKFQTWSTTNPAPTGSMPAQVAAKAMEGFAAAAAADFHRRLLKAYFTENLTISDWDVLCELAAEVGVDRVGFADFVAEHRTALSEQVIDEHNSAIESGITAVPTVVIDGLLPVPGAQDVDVYEVWINRLVEQRSTTA